MTAPWIELLPQAPLSRRRWLGAAVATLPLVGIGRWGTHSALADEAPLRDGKKLRVHTREPMNAEPPPADLLGSWLTPISSFYVRTHGNTPELDPKSWRLTIEGLVEKPIELTLADLAKHAMTKSTATMTCAGNRRAEMSAVKPIPGVPWGSAAIGNATWGGVRLADVLKRAGVKAEAKHIWFEAVDTVKKPDGSTTAFGGSIPLEKAMSDREGSAVLLATTMNDRPLTADHGFPVRTVTPGYIGARSVKWLGKIVVSDRSSPNYFMSEVYKVLLTGEAEEVRKAEPILTYPVNGAIASLSNGDKVAPGMAKVRGYALPTGIADNPVEKVEVSTDGGKTWTAGRITSPKREFCWSLWEADVNVTKETKRLTVRVTDAKGNVQPQMPPWNQKGYLFNSWHSVEIAAKDA
ncbi:MAG: molybdopterin-dependent oxidoreductase [Planctomycetaceae bacterium]|nr:molybdopterin-dependent oxidoreductase [Planctomycetaceae bacterium]